jgi:hypothetical protein
VRGLPAIPNDVARFVCNYSSDGARASVSFWINAPGLDSAVSVDTHLLLGNLILAALGRWSQLQHSGCQLVTCRLVYTGSAPFDILEMPSPNHGLFDGAAPNQCATGLHWQTTSRPQGGQSITHIPGFPDQFTLDHLTLSPEGFADARSAALGFLNDVNAIAVSGFPSVRLGTVLRSAGGTPRGASLFVPFFDVSPVPVITTIRRRMRQAR